jgi:hypothetical protein
MTFGGIYFGSIVLSSLTGTFFVWITLKILGEKRTFRRILILVILSHAAIFAITYFFTFPISAVFGFFILIAIYNLGLDINLANTLIVVLVTSGILFSIPV